MRRNRAALIARIAFQTIVATVALATAPAVFGQPVTPRPRINTPLVVSPVTVPTICTPDGTNNGTPCSRPSVPTLTPTLPPIPKPVTPRASISPKTGLTPASPGSGAAIGGDKVLSYFQRGITHVDTRKAFGFVLMPKSAVTEDERQVQARFCQLMLASLEFTTPDAAARREALVTYWPIVATRAPVEIEASFEARNCEHLLAWYDHNLARSVAARAGVAALGGPLLITWPSADSKRAEDRDPLVVDFAKADHARATKALAYWFRELTHKPELWTSRIREGTIRAELADAINDTAGVVVAMLSGKWQSVTAVSDTP